MENSINKEKIAEEKRCSIWKGRTLLERYLFLVCILLFIAFIVMIGVLLHKENVRKKSQKKYICLSDVCKHEAGSILTNMDFTVDPCQNFYQFACGSYMKYKDIYSPKIRSFTNLIGYILYQSKEVLEKPEFWDGLDFYNKVKKYYQSCLNKSTDISEVLEDFLKENQLNSWPISEDHLSTSTIENVAVLSEVYDGTGLLFRLSRRQNNTYIKVSIGRTIVDAEVLLNTTEEKFFMAKEKYLNLFNYVFMKLRLPTEDSKRYIEKMIDFETSLIKMKEEYKNDNSTNSTISELESECPQIKWNDMFKLLFKYSGYADEYNEEIRVKLSSMEYIRNLCKLIGTSNENKRIIYDLLIWNMFLRYLARFDLTFRQHLLDIKYTNIYDVRVVPGMNELKWKACIMDMETLVRLGLDYVMILSMRPEEEVKEVKSFAKQISEVLEEIFSEEDWFDNNSKNKTRNKLQHINYSVGYSNFSVNVEILNQIFNNLVITDNYMHNILSVKKQIFSKNIFDENAYKQGYFHPFEVTAYYGYSQTGEKIVIPLAIMNSPFYVYGVPKYLNYGGIAFVIGHEFSHGFDHMDFEKEREEKMKNSTDEKDNLPEVEWTEEFIEEFKQRKDCLINQYFQFPLEGNLTINGNKTIWDNIADNSGLTVAYRAYEKYLEKHGKEPLLPGLDFTNRQMFFIGYAQVWCEIIESMKDTYEDDSHSPGNYRVIVPLMNSPEFSEVFNCPLNSYMNPELKCRMWG